MRPIEKPGNSAVGERFRVAHIRFSPAVCGDISHKGVRKSVMPILLDGQFHGGGDTE
jgi:hypothetical protein